LSTVIRVRRARSAPRLGLHPQRPPFALRAVAGSLARAAAWDRRAAAAKAPAKANTALSASG
jgi:hypothetical protein